MLATLFAGCGTYSIAPVSERTPASAVPVQQRPGAATPRAAAPAGTYVVKPGDTLYGIALDHGLDYKDLAAWNKLDNVSMIRSGEVLRLTAPPPVAVAKPLKTPGGKVQARPLGTQAQSLPPAVPLAPGTASPPGAAAGGGTQPTAVRVPYSDQAWAQYNKQPTPPAQPQAVASNTASKPDTAAAAGDLGWVWPTAGKVVSQFSSTANLKGIGIAGKLGQPVVASAAGRVVYSGSGLRGYGKLIIIKHNATYLSVYAHNSVLLVKEGDTVAKGQKIAEMGDSDAKQVELHFEIRRYGQPVDPLKLLPGRG